MEITTRLRGFKELADALKELPQRVAVNALRASATAGAAEIRNEARRLAPVWTGPVSQGHPPAGTLKKAIYSAYSRSRSQPHAAVAIVSVRTGKNAFKNASKGKAKANKVDAYYARWVEFGHFTATPKGVGSIRARRKQAQASGQARWVPPRPFLRPAFASAKGAAIRAVGIKLQARLTQEAERMRAAVARAC